MATLKGNPPSKMGGRNLVALQHAINLNQRPPQPPDHGTRQINSIKQTEGSLSEALA